MNVNEFIKKMNMKKYWIVLILSELILLWVLKMIIDVCTLSEFSSEYPECLLAFIPIIIPFSALFKLSIEILLT